MNENACFYLFSTYVIAYADRVLRLDAGWALLAVNLAAALEFVTVPLYGWLSDHWSRRRMYVFGSLVLAGFAWPYYALLDLRHPLALIAAVVASLAGVHALLYSVQAALIPELFGTRLRYTGASLGYQLASPLAGGLAPIIATSLSEVFPGRYWPLVLYVVFMSGVSLACVLALSETSRKDLSAGD